jgi:hypothetical protein
LIVEGILPENGSKEEIKASDLKHGAGLLRIIEQDYRASFSSANINHYMQVNTFEKDTLSKNVSFAKRLYNTMMERLDSK